MGALGEAAYVRGRGQLLHLDEFRPLHDVTVLGRDLDRFAYAAYVCELADVVLWESQPDEHGYEVVRAVLGRLIRHPPTAALLRCFELQLLGTLGELPLFDRCCVCGTVVDPSPEDTIGFDIVRGGAMCRLHAEAAPRIDVGVARLCTALGGLPTDPQLVPSFGDADLTVRKALRDLLLDLVARRTQRPLRSVEFFTKLKQFAPLPRT
jgi:DNA repair protein RecO